MREEHQQNEPKSPIKSRRIYGDDAQDGIDAKSFAWSDEMIADCQRIANKLEDLCDVRCPDLPKAV